MIHLSTVPAIRSALKSATPAQLKAIREGVAATGKGPFTFELLRTDSSLTYGYGLTFQNPAGISTREMRSLLGLPVSRK